MYTPKEKVRVVIGTSTYRIEGDVHILAGGRLTDLVNVKARDFWAVTNAVIRTAADDRVLYEIDYGVVARDNIIFLFPLEETSSKVQPASIPSSGGE
ncbi:MAG: hypothetical protein C4521_10720 [Actinobacteria bacterium]|nr:MAG: hypothetical protein C4521_10720 [Actinomycetota bacterium]